jgi:hypothetical protein
MDFCERGHIKIFLKKTRKSPQKIQNSFLQNKQKFYYHTVKMFPKFNSTGKNDFILNISCKIVLEPFIHVFHFGFMLPKDPFFGTQY